MAGLTKNDWKGLWAILWRVLILGPIVGVFGLVFLVLVFAAFIVPPFYAIIAFMTGDWLFGSAALAGWLVVLHYREPLLRWSLEGFEHSSL